VAGPIDITIGMRRAATPALMRECDAALRKLVHLGDAIAMTHAAVEGRWPGGRDRKRASE
jgi:hypothetical protein